MKDLEVKIRKASQTSCSDQNFAVNLMQIFFQNHELVLDNLNVYGKNLKGMNEKKLALDEKRVEFIQHRVRNRLNGDEKMNKLVWDQCVSAMNKKLGQLRLAFKKGNLVSNISC